MKKTIMFLGVLSLGLAQAQQNAPYEGKVGVNTETPSATLNVKSKTGTTSATKNFELENANETKMVTVLDNGNVGIGNAKPGYILDIKSANDKYEQNNVALRFARNAQKGTSGMDFFRARGTTEIPEAVQQWDFLNGMQFFGYVGKAYQPSSRIWSMVTGVPTDSTVPTSLLFKVYGDNLDGNRPEFILHHTGNVGIGLDKTILNTTDSQPGIPAERLQVNGAIKVGSVYYSTYIKDGAKTPVPTGGVGTIVYQDDHFYGWIGDTKGWKQLDNPTNALQLYDTEDIGCDETNRGKMNFRKDVPLASGGTADVMGVCLKGSDGNYYWNYMYGNGGKSTGGYGFGLGL